MQALHQFAADQPDANVRLSVRPLPRADETLHPLIVDLAISLHVPLGLLGEPLMELEYVAVANPRHPLFRLGRELSVPDLVKHVQVTIANEPSLNRLAEDNDPAYAESGTQRMHRWDVSSFDTAIEAVQAGLGYAWLPSCRIRKSLDEGLLAALPLRAGLGFKATLYLIHGRSGPACHGTGRLAELLRKAVGAMESPSRAR
jgi:DNA-binding transcriptional LysR family regulator